MLVRPREGPRFPDPSPGLARAVNPPAPRAWRAFAGPGAGRQPACAAGVACRIMRSVRQISIRGLSHAAQETFPEAAAEAACCPPADGPPGAAFLGKYLFDVHAARSRPGERFHRESRHKSIRSELSIKTI